MTSTHPTVTRHFSRIIISQTGLTRRLNFPRNRNFAMNLTMSGLPAIVVQVGFIVVFSAPVWLAAKLVGAERPTMIRAALS